MKTPSFARRKKSTATREEILAMNEEAVQRFFASKGKVTKIPEGESSMGLF